jgi:hypothetical protein
MPALITRGLGLGLPPGRRLLRGLTPGGPAGPTAAASLLTRGYGAGSTPGRVLLRGLTTGAVVALSPDLLAAAWEALAASTALATAFGRPAGGRDGWLWRDDNPIPPDVRLPFLILAQDTIGEPDPPTYDGDTVQPVWLRIDIYATDRDASTPARKVALALARSVLAVLDPAEPPTPLEWENGIELYRRVNRADPEMLPGGIGPGGRLVAGVRLRIEFMTQFNIYYIA